MHGGQHATMNRAQRRMAKPRSGPVRHPAAPTLQAEFAAALREHQAGFLKEAGRRYRRILAVNPHHADSLHLLGVIAQEDGELDRAVQLIERAIAINAVEAPYHANLGTARWKQGRLADAIACYCRALELRPDYAKAHFNLATVLWKQGKLPEAAACFRDSLRRKPDYAEAYDNLGSVLKEQDRPDEAIACYRTALSLRPHYPEAHNNLGTLLLAQGQPEDAIDCYRKALALRPDYHEAHCNLGIALWEQGRPDAAVACYRDALAIWPDYVDAYLNMGTALKELGRLDEAAACCREVLARDPDQPEAHSNLGIILLAQGDLAAGWREHEWRWKTPQMRRAHRDFAQPQWRGETAAGQTLLIHAEQGFGDTLQFCRYAPLAAARVSRVILEAQKPLVRLLRGLPGVDLVVVRGEERPAFDVHCPMLSLPLALGTTLATIPGGTPYLKADATLSGAWRTRLAATAAQGWRVGLVWAGNRRIESKGLAAVDRRRSMSPDCLAPLFELPGLHFVSLQKSGPEAPARFPLTDFMAEMEDFADTGALIANLDLVISVDTAVAHLAAALGKPVWLLDRFDACWRWFTGRRDSPWYPGLRIYRQPRPGDWSGVVDEVVADLAGHFAP